MMTNSNCRKSNRDCTNILLRKLREDDLVDNGIVEVFKAALITIRKPPASEEVERWRSFLLKWMLLNGYNSRYVKLEGETFAFYYYTAFII